MKGSSLRHAAILKLKMCWKRGWNFEMVLLEVVVPSLELFRHFQDGFSLAELSAPNVFCRTHGSEQTWSPNTMLLPSCISHSSSSQHCHRSSPAIDLDH
jgi:hypothetical protein